MSSSNGVLKCLKCGARLIESGSGRGSNEPSWVTVLSRDGATLEIPICTLVFEGLGAKSPHPQCQPMARSRANDMYELALLNHGARRPIPRAQPIISVSFA